MLRSEDAVLSAANAHLLPVEECPQLARELDLTLYPQVFGRHRYQARALGRCVGYRHHRKP